VTVTSDDGKVTCTYVTNPTDQTNGRDKGIPDLIIDPDFGYATTITTSMGVIEADLFVNEAPCTVNSWDFLAQKGFFDGLTFHRVAKNPPVIQGGDPAGQGFGGPGYTFADELDNDLQYERGTLAMANSGPNTNGSQFFIMAADYAFPKSYTIFGKVTKGMDVVDKIHAVQTDANEHPVDPVTIESVTITVKPLGSPTPSVGFGVALLPGPDPLGSGSGRLLPGRIHRALRVAQLHLTAHRKEPSMPASHYAAPPDMQIDASRPTRRPWRPRTGRSTPTCSPPRPRPR
jgi:cyclophilin family peptidyl-prolyl cis-trans isomerase